MGATLADLLRYKKSIDIRHPETGELVKTIWMRVLGDLDLTTAYKKARIASAAKRLALRDPNSDDYMDEVLGVADLSREEQIDLVKTANLSKFVAESQVVVERPDLPKIEEVAAEPDAATLEELEALDKKEIEIEETYQNKLNEYVELRQEELQGRLESLSPEELLAEAQREISNLVPFTLFITELNDWKVFFGTFTDQSCKTKEFETIEEFRQLPRAIKQFLVEEMNQLEIDGVQIKN